MMNVQNELGVIVVFAQTCQDHGWKINHIQSEFPDAIIQDENGDTYRAEFEFCAANFRTHQHDLLGCDVIICWENDWTDCPLTVWSMQDWNDYTITLCDRRDLKIANLTIENKRLRKQNSRLRLATRTTAPENRREKARLILDKHPGTSGTELAEILDCSGSLARRYKREIKNNGNGHKMPEEVRE